MRKDLEDEMEGSDLEQMIAMLERAELDHEVDNDDDEEVVIYVNDKIQMIFDEEGNLLNISLPMN